MYHWYGPLFFIGKTKKKYSVQIHAAARTITKSCKKMMLHKTMCTSDNLNNFEGDFGFYL